MEIDTLSEVSQIPSSTRGNNFEKDLLYFANNGFHSTYVPLSGVDVKIIKECFLKIGFNEEEIERDKPLDPKAERISTSKSKTDLIISGFNISVKLLPAQLVSIEPHTTKEITQAIINILEVDKEKYSDTIKNLQNLSNNLLIYKDRYVKDEKELKSEIRIKYERLWNKAQRGEKSLENTIRRYKISPEKVKNKEDFLHAMEISILSNIQRMRDPNVEKKSIKVLKSIDDFEKDREVVEGLFKKSWTEDIQDELVFEFATGYYTKSAKFVANHLLYVDEKSKKVFFEDISSAEKLKKVLSLFQIEKRIAGKSRGSMTKALNFRYDIKIPSLEKNPKQQFKEFLLETIQNTLEEELEKQEQLVSHIKDKLDSIDKEDLKIVSVTPSNKSDMAMVIRFEDKKDIESARGQIKKVLAGDGITIKDRMLPKYDTSSEITQVSYDDGGGRVYIVYKYDVGSREGLALEHVVALLLTGKVTEQLKNRLDLPPEASKEEVKEKLKGDYADVLSVALQGKKMIEDKIGKVTETKSLGSKNAKADLILIGEDGIKYGLSIKLVTEEGRELRFTYNKNLGYGDETDDNPVKSPSGEPWWLIGRKILAKKVGKSYNPKKDDFEPPSWMMKEKENKTDAYKESMEEVYEKLRSVYVDNLRSMKLLDLVQMVNDAHLGENEEDYEKLLVLVSDVDGIRLEEQDGEKPDIQKIKDSGINKKDIVKTDGARIIIDIPGMSPLTIHGLKFQNNMLSSSMNDLKIKTR